MTEHKEVMISISPTKIVLVDEGIVPVVEWLNGFSSVETIFSCEGKGFDYSSYVSFFCDDPADLSEIIDCVQRYQLEEFFPINTMTDIECRFQFYPKKNKTMYSFHFRDRSIVNGLLSYCRNKFKPLSFFDKEEIQNYYHNPLGTNLENEQKGKEI